MILISKIKIIKTLLSLLFILFISSTTHIALAQSSLTLSISPSLYDMSINPGQEWRSTLRIINVNDFDLTVYIDVLNFSPQGEGGDGKFLPVPSDATGSTIAEWFTISREAIVVPREKSEEVPFSVRVPMDASPGGHFAAIVVGTKPPVAQSGESKVQTSQMVTSLFFARVAGDINELGTIREFTTEKFLNSPEATFDLRFENRGNVHLQPQGDIIIYNMWGQERGLIPINQGSQFGNVLPESIRKFTFAWKGEWSVSDIGRYSAVATLAYGTESRQFASAKTYFWVIPYKLLLGIFIGLAFFVATVTWLVRLYVRRMLVMAGIDINQTKHAHIGTSGAITKKIAIHSPLHAGLEDFKQRLRMTVTFGDKAKALLQFIISYKIFFIAVALIVCVVFILYWFISNANVDHRGYEVTYVNSDANVKLTSEDIIYNQLVATKGIPEPTVNDTLPLLSLVNRSGVPGLGAEARIRLESLGYRVVSLEADFSSPISRTVIVASLSNQESALRLSSRLNNALISTNDDEVNKDVITVYVGDDIESE
jgi:hypothetical protein